MITKSDFMKYHTCKLQYFLKKNKLEEPKDKKSVIDQANEIEIMATNFIKEKFNIKDSKEITKIGATPDFKNIFNKTEIAMNEKVQMINQCAFKTTLSNVETWALTDILLLNDEGKYELYEIKSKTDSKFEKDKKQDLITELSYQKKVLDNCGIEINSFNVVLINHQYKKSNDNEFFVIYDLTNELVDVKEELIIEIENFLKTDIEEVKKLCNIKKCDKCSFTDACKEFGIITEKECFITPNIEVLKEFLQDNKEWYTLDFETIMPAVPKLYWDKPYSQFITQMIMVDQNNNLVHDTLSTDLNFIDVYHSNIRKMLEISNTDKKIIVYHKMFEIGRIKEIIANEFLDEEIKLGLQKFINNIWDLADVFKHNKYWSLKLVSKNILGYDPYLECAIKNGEECMEYYHEYVTTKNEERKLDLEYFLKEYCMLDNTIMNDIIRKLGEHNESN